MDGKKDVVSVEQEVVVLVEEQQEVMTGKEVVVSVEQQEVATEQFGKSADGSDHSRALADLRSKFLQFPSSPSSSEVVVSVEQQEVATEQFGKSADGSDHSRTLAELKFKFIQLPKSPSSSELQRLQCPKVPEKLRADVKDKDYYAPKLISLGPYYHGESKLEVGETLKLKLAEAYIQSCGLTVDKIYGAIRYRISKLRGCYDAESTKKYKDDKFTEMMLVDGCALLSYIFCVCFGDDHRNYDIRYEDLSLLHQDALLLENQLPYQLLQVLMKTLVQESAAATVLFQKFFGMIDTSFFQEFFGNRKPEPKTEEWESELEEEWEWEWEPEPDEESRLCHHLLDFYRINFLGDESPSATHYKKGHVTVLEVKEQVMASFRNVKELMDAGIRIKRSPTRHLRDISFRSNGITACLRIPPITIDNSTKAMFLNLIAYEMSSDVDHDFISYLRFLDSLIDHADDVKELQSIGILQNNLGTHEEVAQFFNTVSANLESNFHAYKDVRVKIRKHLQSHYNSKLTMWMTQCLDTYFGSPWTIIAWVGAALALFLTFVQTYFSVFPH